MNNLFQPNERLQIARQASPRSAVVFVTGILLATFGLARPGYGVTPAPDGGYPGFNTAEGTSALLSLTSGVFNTALGGQALFRNTTGGLNTAVGLNSLFQNTTGNDNTAVGFEALFANTIGFQNTATGWRALLENSTGFHNTASGFEALLLNTTGNHNTADGDVALLRNTTGSFNTASGAHSLELNTTGNSNIALGFQAGVTLTTGSNNIDVGNAGVAAESQTTRIGTEGIQTRSFVAGINGSAVVGTPIAVDGKGQLGVMVSSKRFKDEITSMDKASEAILSLRPVTFRYKRELDPAGNPQFGLLAEEVEKVDPDLVTHDAAGKPYTVRYDAVNVMLLNEFLKEHRKVESLEATLSREQGDSQAIVLRLQTEIKELGAQIQEVHDRLEIDKSRTRLVNHIR